MRQPHRSQPGLLPHIAQPIDMVVKKLELVEVDGEADSSLGDTSEGVNGRLLPHLITKVGEEGGLDVGWAVLLSSVQDPQLQILCSEDRGGVGSRSNIPGTSKPKTSQSSGEVGLLPLGVIQGSAKDARGSLPGDLVKSLPAHLMVGGVSGPQGVHDLPQAKAGSQQNVLHLRVLEKRELVCDGLDLVDPLVDGLSDIPVAADGAPKEDDALLLNSWNPSLQWRIRLVIGGVRALHSGLGSAWRRE